MMSLFRQRGRNLENEDLFTTMGQGSRGKEVSSEWGGGGGEGVPTVTVPLFQTLFNVVKRRMIKNLASVTSFMVDICS